MADETLQQQPPTFSDELYKYAHDSGFIPKEATFDIFKKNLSNKDFVKELYDYSVQTEFIPKEATIDIFIKNIGGTTPDLKKKGSTVSPSGGGSSGLPKIKYDGKEYGYNPSTLQVFQADGTELKQVKLLGKTYDVKDYLTNVIGLKPQTQKPQAEKPAEQPKPYTTSQVAVELKKKVELNPDFKRVAKIYKDYNAANKNLLNAQMDLTAGLQGEKDVIQTDVLGKPVAIQGSITEQKIKRLKENVDLAKANKQAAKENLIKVSPAFKDKNIDIVAELQKDNIDVEETVIPQAVEKIKFVEDISDLEDNLKANGQTLDDWSKYVYTEAPKEFLDDKQRALFDVIKTGDEAKIKKATDVYYKDIDDQISQIDKDITALSVGKFNTAVDVPQRIADLKKQKQDLIDSKAGALQPEAALKKVAAIDSSFDVVDKMLKDIPPTQRAKLLFDKLYADKIKEQAKFGKDMSDTKAMGTGFRAVTERNKLRDIDQALNILAPIVFLNQKPDMQQSGWTRFGRGVWNSMVGDATGVTLPKKEDIGNKVTSLMAQATVDENITPQFRESIKNTTPDITDQAIDMGAYITSILPYYGAMGAVAKGARLPALFRIGFNNVGKYAPLVGRIAPQLTRMTTEGVTSKLAGLAMDEQDELTFWGRFGGQGFTELIYKSPFGKLVSKAIGKMGVKEPPAFLKVLGRLHKQGVGETGGESIEEAYTIYQNSDTFDDFKKNIKRFVDNPSEGLLFLGGTYLMGVGLGGVSPNISKKFYTAADKAYNDLPPNEQAAFDNFVKDVNQGQEDAVMEVVLKTVDKIPNRVVDGLVTDLNKAVEELGKTEVGENGYEVKIGDTVYQGNTAQDLQNDIDDAQSLLAIYKGEQDNRTQNGITIEETETPTIAEADKTDVELAKPEAGVSVEGEVAPEQKGDIQTKQKETEAKIKRKDLFADGGTFANQLGGSGENSVPTNHREVNGIEFVEFSNPTTGIVDVVMTGTSDTDYVGYYRIYENGKPTNKWSSKFENQSRNKANFKTMISGAQEMLPQGHEYTEKTSISTDGLRVWGQQLERGYELQRDANGKLKTNRVAINGDAIENELGIPVNKGNFDNISVTNNADMKKVKSALLPYLQKFGLDENNIHFENGTVEIDLPVLKQTTTTQAAPTTTQESPINTANAPETTQNAQENGQQPHTAGYATIAADYLFTGGRDVILSTDYLLQAMIGSFQHAATAIDNIRNKYAAKLGNIKDDVGTDTYNKMMQEIRDAINNSYGNNADIEAIFDKILNSPTGFTFREGNALSQELDRLNDAYFSNNSAALETTEILPQGVQVKDTVSEKQVPPTETSENPALKNVASTATALSKLDKGTIDATLPMQSLEIDGYKREYRTDSPLSIAEAYHKAKADGSNPDLVQAVEELLAPKGEVKAEPSVKAETTPTEKVETEPTADIDNVADKAGIAPKNLRDLYNINRTLFGLNKVKSLAAAVAMDRMVGVMAKRAGITKAEMYGRLEFKKDTEANVLKADNALFQGTVNGENVTLRNTDVDVVNGFYSPLRKIIAEAKQDKMPAKQWIEKFARGEEAKWTGLTDWLASQQGSVSKADILDYLKNNRISIVEVVKGLDKQQVKYKQLADMPNAIYGYAEKFIETGDKRFLTEIEKEGYTVHYDNNGEVDYFTKEGKTFEIDNTKFSQYQLEGDKSNYKEVLITLPSSETEEQKQKRIDDIDKKRNELKSKIDSLYNQRKDETKEYKDLVSERERLLQERNKIIYNQEDKDFRSSHFNEPNILVHLRMNTRTDAEGNKVLFLEEVQSDWGQEGKRKGFGKGEKITNVYASEKVNRVYEIRENNLSVIDTIVADSKEEALSKYLQNPKTREEAVPTAPFVTDTNAWVKLGLKVALKEAVAQGADKIAWTTGEQQNDRYDLSRQVDEIQVLPQYGGSKMTYAVQGFKNGEMFASHHANTIADLEGIVGKEIATKVAEKGEYEGELSFKGDDLKVGGKGMKGFYGSPTEGSLGIVGNAAKSLFKQEPKTIGIKVSDSSVDLDTPPNIIKLSNGEYVVQTPFIDSLDSNGENPSFKNKEDANSFYVKEKNRFDNEISKVKTSTQNSITITPELRTQVQNGLALFQKQQGQTAKGAMVAADGKFIIYALTDPNVSTPLHEVAHVFEHYLTDSERAAVNNWAKTGAWTTETSEKFARGFEKYLSEGIAPTEGLKKVFEKFAKWLTDIYNGIKGSDIDIQLNDDMRSIYAKMLGEDAVPTKKTKAAPKKQDVEIASVFNSNPELAKIGTPEQYSQYLDSIFPNSKVTLSKKFADTYNIIFNGETIGTIDIPSDLEGDTISIGDVNIKPEFRGKGLGVETYKAAMKIAGKPLESFMATDEANRVWNSLIKQGLAKKTDTGFITISPLLGTKQDIDGFKEFVAKKSPKKAIQSDVIDKLVGKATERKAAVENIADENIKEFAKAVTDTKVIDKVMDAIDNNDQLLADLEKKLGIKKICRI